MLPLSGKVEHGDLLDFPCDYIIQQCNCITLSSKGLSSAIEDKFPSVDVYKCRTKEKGNIATASTRDQPGHFKVYKGCPNVVCLFGQYRPGKCDTGYYAHMDLGPTAPSHETTQVRLCWFKQALQGFGFFLRQQRARHDTVSMLMDKESKQNSGTYSVAFPYLIGCGLAGGDWQDYANIIQEFQDIFFDVVRVTILQNEACQNRCTNNKTTP